MRSLHCPVHTTFVFFCSKLFTLRQAGKETGMAREETHDVDVLKSKEEGSILCTYDVLGSQADNLLY